MSDDDQPGEKLTFRRFKTGETMWDWDDLTEKIFQAGPLPQVPDLCPPHAALPGELPVGPRHSRLAGDRARHGQAAGRRHAVAGIRLPAHGGGQSVPGGDGPRVPGAVRGRLQSQRGRRFRRHQRASSSMSATGRSSTACRCRRRRRYGGKKVAVIGGGPAGLSAAYFLRRNGPRRDVIFEAHDKLGGMMRFGIPGYRTPRDKLDAEIGRILALGGIETRLNTRVGRTSRSTSWSATSTPSSGRSARRAAGRCRCRAPMPRTASPASNSSTPSTAAGCSPPPCASSWSAAATPRSTSPRWRAASATSPAPTSTMCAPAPSSATPPTTSPARCGARACARC